MQQNDPKFAITAKRASLLEERARLQAQIDKLDDKIRAIDLIVQDKQFLAFVLGQNQGTDQIHSNGNGSAQVAAPPTGLRAAIRDALSRYGQPMKPVEVSGMLYNAGFQAPQGLNWLKLRVSQEMHRMYTKSKQLKRLPSGRYRLIDSEAGEEAK